MIYDTTLLYPIVILMFFTFISTFVAIFSKVYALKTGQIELNDVYFLKVDPKYPVFVNRATEHLKQLFEVPILFYISCIVISLYNFNQDYFIALAWLFVAFQLLQSIVQLFFDKYLLRLVFFMCANSFLFVLVLMMLIKIAKYITI